MLAAAMAMACSEAPELPDVVSELPGELRQRNFVDVGPPTVECMTPEIMHPIDNGRLEATVKVRWTTNLKIEVERQKAALGVHVDGESVGVHQTSEPIYLELPFGEHLVSIALQGPDGSALNQPSSRCSVRVQVTRPCTSDSECVDDFDCSDTTCAPSSDGINRCQFLPVASDRCCQYDLECAFNEICDTDRHECVACKADTDCNDESTCTVDSCKDGQCHFVKSDPLCCDCNAKMTPQSSVNSQCDDGLECTTDSCECASSRCSFVSNTQSAEPCCESGDPQGVCDDGNACTVDNCTNGVCQSEALNDQSGECCNSNAECHDANPCTNDVCDTSINRCIRLRVNTPDCQATEAASSGQNVTSAGATCANDKPQKELCNGLDDDCDGLVDENEDGQLLSKPCKNACGDTGESVCDSGAFVACTATDSIEVCDDDVDNDCDGTVDESWPNCSNHASNVPGATVQVVTTLGHATGTVVDNGDGTYRTEIADLANPNRTGVAYFNVNGIQSASIPVRVGALPASTMTLHLLQGSLHIDRAEATLLVELSDAYGRPVAMGTEVVANFSGAKAILPSKQNRRTTCATDQDGRCYIRWTAPDDAFVNGGTITAAISAAGLQSITAELAVIRAPQSLRLSAVGAGLSLPRSAINAGESFDVPVYLQAGHRTDAAAYDLSIAFEQQNIEVVGVSNGRCERFGTPINNVKSNANRSGTLHLNAVGLHDENCPLEADGSMHVATVTFRAFRPANTAWHATLRHLVATDMDVILNDAPILIADRIGVSPTGTLAIQTNTTQGILSRVDDYQLLSMGPISGQTESTQMELVGYWQDGKTFDPQENMDCEFSSSRPTVATVNENGRIDVGVQAGTTNIQAVCDGQETSQTIHVLTLANVDVILSDDQIQAIAGTNGTLQTPSVQAIANWVNAKGHTVWRQDITDSVTLKLPEGLSYEPVKRQIQASTIGTHVIAAQGHAGSVLGKTTLTVDPSNVVQCDQLQVLTPCELQISSPLPRQPSPQLGRVWNTLSVSSKITRAGQSCPIGLYAMCDDGTRMNLTGRSDVTIVSGTPENVAIENEMLRGQASGTSNIQALWTVDGYVIGSGSTTVQVDLPEPVAITVHPASSRMAKSAKDLSTTLLNLPTQQTLAVVAHYADGTSNEINNAQFTLVDRDGSSLLVQNRDGSIATAGNGAGIARIQVRIPEYPNLSAEAIVEVVEATGMIGEVYESYSPTTPQVPVRQLSQIERSNVFQDARFEVRVRFSDGTELDVSTHENTQVTARALSSTQEATDVLTIEKDAGRFVASAAGSVDLHFAHGSFQNTIAGFEVTSSPIDIVSLHGSVSSGPTFSGIKDLGTTQINVWATLADGTRRWMTGDQHIADLLSFHSANVTAATVNAKGLLTIRGNGSVLTSVRINDEKNARTTLEAASEIAIDCNLVAAPGDMDLGRQTGLAFPDVQIGEQFSYSVRLNTGNQNLGAFDVRLDYDPGVLEVVEVKASDAFGNNPFQANWQSTNGVIYINGIVSPSGTSVQGENVELFSVHYTAIKGGDGISEVGGEIMSLIADDATTIIGEVTPRPIVAGAGFVDPNCENEPIYGDANDNCEFAAEDGLFIQRYLAGLETPTAMQLDKMNVFPDTEVSLIDALYASLVLAKLTHFVNVFIEPSTSGNADIIVKVIDRDQQVVTNDVDVEVEVSVSSMFAELGFDQLIGIGVDPQTKLAQTTHVGEGRYRAVVKGLGATPEPITLKVGVLMSTLTPDGADILKRLAFLGSQEIIGGKFTKLMEFVIPLTGSSGCFSDADCDPVAAFCDNIVGPGSIIPTFLCTPKRDDGQLCPKSTACKTNHCQNDYCCADGDCCVNLAQCPATYAVPSECQNAGNCQGIRKDPTCLNFMCGNTPVNDDTACAVSTESKGCGCYNSVYCSGDSDQTSPDCPVDCVVDTECDDSCHCDGTCEPDLPNGSACDENSDCISDHCNNNICCDSGHCCDTTTFDPNVGQADAQCTALIADPTCTDPLTCQGTRSVGQCNTTTFQCEETKIPNDNDCTTDQKALDCGCTLDVFCAGGENQLPPSCPVVGCTNEDNSTCKENCHCDTNNCVEDLPNGSACDENSDCISAYCSNGFCCDNDGSNPVCCGVPENCTAEFSEPAVCFAGAQALITGFSSTQGANQWTYETHNQVTGYVQMLHSNQGTSQWSGASSSSITATSMRPGGSSYAAALGYQVRGGGALTVSGTLSDDQPGTGDGIRIEVRQNENVVYSKDLANGFNTVPLAMVLDVAANDIVRVVVVPKISSDGDVTNISLTMTLATCQGDKVGPVCESGRCGSAIFENDTGCGNTTVARQCSPYSNVFCDGSIDQHEPVCAETCTSDAELTAGMGCIANTPFVVFEFEDGQGETIADKTGNGLHGRMNSGKQPTWVAGQAGTALAFAQSGTPGASTADAVSIDGTAPVRFMAGIGVGAWIKWGGPGISSDQIIVGKGSEWGLGLRNGKLAFHANAETGAGSLWVLSAAQQSKAIPSDVWTHVGASWDGALLRLYVNGAVVSKVVHTGLLPHKSEDILLGQLSETNTNIMPYMGAIDGVFLTDFPLSDGQFTDFIKGGSLPASSSAAALFLVPTSYLTFDSSETQRTWGNMAIGTANTGGNNGKGANWVTGFAQGHGCGTLNCGNSGAGHLGYPEMVSGKWGHALSFGQFGASDSLMQDSATLHLTKNTDFATNGFTAAAWVKWGGIGESSTQWIINKPGQWGIGLHLGKPFVVVNGNSVLKSIFDAMELTAVSTDAWTHLAASWDGQNIRLYVNGILVADVAFVQPMAANTHDIHIGQAGGSNANHEQYLGLIDEVVILQLAMPETTNCTGACPAGGTVNGAFQPMLDGNVIAPPTKVGVTKRFNGSPCPEDANNACIGGHCANQFCCDIGICCTQISQCPQSFTLAPSCDDIGTCQGTRGDPMCVSFQCATNVVDDDTGCLTTTEAQTCGCYTSLFCDGDIAQSPPICPTGCGDDTACDSNCTCDNVCKPKEPNGTSCDEDADCISGFCTDGVCCDALCDSLCNSCSLAGTVGACTLVSDGQDPDNECVGTGLCGGTCDGAGECQYPATTVDCGLCRRCDGVGGCTNLILSGTDPDMDCPLCQVCDGTGACTKSDLGTDIKAECSEASVSTCSTNGVCDGDGACQLYALDTICQAQTCVDGFVHTVDKCDGVGTCQDTGTYSCAPYVCNGDDCWSSCVDASQCNSTAYCDTDTNECIPRKPTGSACANNDQCQTGFCVDGYCCGTSCTALCNRCDITPGQCTNIAASQDPDNECNGAGTCGGTCNGSGSCQFPPVTLNCGNCIRCNGLGDCSNLSASGTDPDIQCGMCEVCDGAGVCTAAASGTDPKGECDPDAQSTCNKDGTCDGSAGCRLWLDGTECVAPKCTTGIGYSKRICDGVGACGDPTQTACDPYVCGANACLTQCQTDTDCIDTHYCELSSNSCVAKKAVPEACEGNNQCVSGFCADGLCCSTACNTECEACNLAGSEGTCTFHPQDSDPEDDCTTCKVCNGSGSCVDVPNNADPLNECSQQPAVTCDDDGVCDGQGACRLWAANTVCVAPTCSNATAQLTDSCDGLGTCVDGGSQSCSPYQCANTSCATTCMTDDGCVATHWCNTPVCQPKKTLGIPCSGSNECQSGFCVDGVCCATACTSVCAQCNLPGTEGTCDAHDAGTDPESGCGDYYCNGIGYCHNTCSTDSDCKADHWCSGNTCVDKKTLGETCSGNNQCMSEFCIDGVCCNNACEGECNACDLTNAEGFCGNVPVGTDPDEECAGTGACGGTCDGQGQCNYPVASLNCGTCRRCDGEGACGYVPTNTDPDTSCPTCQVCDGSGQCKNAAVSTDVKEECSPQTPESDCGLNGSCNGSGACGYYGDTIECSDERCRPLNDYACKLTGTANSEVVCTFRLASKTQANMPAGVSFKLTYDNSKATLNNLSCPILNGAVDTCNAVNGAKLPPAFAGGGGHDILTNPSASTSWAGDVIFSLFDGSGAGIALNNAYLDSTGTTVGNDFVFDMKFTLKETATALAPIQVEITAVDPADGTGTNLGAGVESDGRVLTCLGGGCTRSSTHSFPDKCDGTGVCGDGGTESCSPYVCGATDCRTSCSSHFECVVTHYCSANSTCLSRKDNGEACAEGYECVSSHCQNGYCCPSGNCCASDTDCADFDLAASCTDATNCDGQRTEFTCDGNKQCAGTVIDDDSGCLGSDCVNPFCTGASSILQHVGAKTCNATGQCNQGGAITPCADGNVCTTDSCAAADGCVFNPNTFSQSCYDGPIGTLNIGECKAGTETCADSAFGSCIGQVKPTAELCNTKDDDCDGLVDEADATGCTIYYLDADADTYGVMGSTQCLCAPTYPYTATIPGDCNDADGTVNPGMVESCNGKDDNCNNIIDEEGATGCTTYYKDMDNDSYGLTNDSKCLCLAADPYDTTADGDCNDDVNTTYPDAPELCDGVDNDCDKNKPSGGIDEDFALGDVCDGADNDSCNEGVYTCNTTKDGVQCANDGATVILTGDRTIGSTFINEAESGLDGTVVGIVSTTDTTSGKVDKAMDFAGGGYIAVADDKLMNMSKSGGTVAFWMNSYLLSNGNFSVLAAKGYGSDRTFEIRYYGSAAAPSTQGKVRPYFQIGTSNFYCSNSLTVQPSDGWVHIAVTVTPDVGANQTSMSVYKNGTLDKTCTYPGLVVDNDKILQLGRTTSSASATYIGRLDEFVLYTHGLSATEVQDLWANGIPTANRNNEICDGADNDCSGAADETFANIGNNCSDGLGACALTGAIQCDASGTKTECSAAGGVAAGTACNDTTSCSFDDVCTGRGDVTGAGNAFANKANTGFGADKAFDDNPGSFYEYSGNGPWQLTYDFNNKTRIQAFTVQAGPWGEEGRMPKHFAFQALDGTSWTTLYTGVSQTFSANEKKTYTFANSNAYTQYRLSVTAVGNNGTIIRVFEIEMMPSNSQSECVGTSYSCSGTCRTCNGTGSCTVATDTCFIADNACTITDPACGSAGACKTAGQALGTTGDDICMQCTPTAVQNDWSAAASTKECRAPTCETLTHHPTYLCGSGAQAGTCVAATPVSCDDSNVCTDNNCADASGCFYTNNAHQEACYTGAANSLGVGTCTGGIKTCSGGQFGNDCVGEVLPVTESCAGQGEDGLDNDCDGIIDNINDFTTWCRDVDGDGHGNPAGPFKYHCEQPTGYSSTCDDCDDLDGLRFPGNTEKCDEIDNDCDTQIDEDFTTKGQGCDGPDADVCAERILVCNAAGDGVDCGSDKGPFAAFTFDKGINGSTIVNEAADSNVTTNDAKSKGMSVRLGLQGGLDRAYYTPGKSTQKYMYIPSAGFSGSGWTVALWFYPTSTASKYYLSIAGKGTYNALAVSASGRLYVRGIKKTNSTLKLTKNAWNHIVITHSAKTGFATAHINNQQKWKSYVGKKTFGWTSHVWFGQEQDKLNGGFQSSQAAQGKFDNIALYNYDISDTERNALFNSKIIDPLYLNNELCDGLDNDCDNSTDELYASTLGSACSAGVAPCNKAGAMVCTANALDTECSSTGQSATTTCSDSNLCSHSDLCTGLGDTTSGGTAIGSGDNGPGFTMAGAFDDNEFGTFWEKSGAGPWQLGYDFGSTGARIQSYSLRSGEFGEEDRMPKDWIFQGYTGSSWVTLDTQTGQTFGVVDTKSYSFTNTLAYKKYRLNISSVGNGGNVIRVFEVTMDGGTTASVCNATDYACSGTCRSCDGTGQCTVTADMCFINGGSCNPTHPSSDDAADGGFTVSLCASGTCYSENDDMAGNTNTHTAGDTSCAYCAPDTSLNQWTMRPTTWSCRSSFCDSEVALRFHPTDYCGSGNDAGTCLNTAHESCDDINVCTNDSCADATGCSSANNTIVYDSDCYTGPNGTKNVGVCHGGTQYCKDGGPELLPNSTTAKCNNQTTPSGEICDELDNDCDHNIDEDTEIKYYRDADSDGYGDPANWTIECSQPSGYTDNSLDCVDAGYKLWHTDLPANISSWSNTTTSTFTDGVAHGPFGTGVDLSRTYTGLPTHKKVRIFVRYWAIDSWDSETGQLYVDGTLVWSKTRTNAENCSAGGWSTYTNTLPNPWNGDNDNHKCYEDIDLVVDHTSGSMTVKFSSTIDQAASDESFAISDLRITTDAMLKNPDGYWGVETNSAGINPSAIDVCNGIDDNCSDAIDEGFTDKGNTCDGTDNDLCIDSLKVCNEAGDGTMCLKGMVWGAYGMGGGGSVTDISGFDNHGADQVGHTSSNMPPLKLPYTGSNMDYSQVLDFNGSSNYVRVNHVANSSFDLKSPQITMSAWVRWNGQGGSHIIINKESSYEIGINNGRFACAIQTDGGGGWYWTGSTMMVANKWTHVACTYDTATCKIQTYVSGGKTSETIDNGCGKITPSSDALHIGMRPGGSYFGGQIAAVAIYDRKMSPSEIASRATKSTTPFASGHANFEFCDGLDNDCDVNANGGGTDELYKSGSTALGAACHGGVGDCRNDGTMVCETNQFYWDTASSWGRSTICNAFGDPAGTVCTDNVQCTHTDRCSGGLNSTCNGTAYTCSGTCRSCNGTGTCDLAADTCYITGSTCSIVQSNCAGTCYDENESSNSVSNSNNAGNTSCTYCSPDTSTNTWTNRPNTWQCRATQCTGLTFNYADTCNGSGACTDNGTTSCVDGALCTDDQCSHTGGCSNPNNTYSQSCYTGAAGTLDVGDCHAGTETCANGTMGNCLGQVTPSTELCDAQPYNDEDCDGGFNEAGGTGCVVYYKDADGDGYGLTNDFKCLCSASAPYSTTLNGDCDDANKNAAPNLPEKCGTAYDDNCNGTINEDYSTGSCTQAGGLLGYETYYKDVDNDGYGLSNNAKCKCTGSGHWDTKTKGDCDDGAASVHPNATEKCNSVDDDCDNKTDEDYDVGDSCTKGSGTCLNTGSKICNSAGNGTICDVTGKPAGTECTDSNLCTHGDVCSGGDASTCQGTAYSCDDSKSCTHNNCVDDRLELCSYPIKSGKCLIGGTCHNTGSTKTQWGDGRCHVCAPSTSQTAWSANSGTTVCATSGCATGLVFHKNDYCGTGGNAKKCVDGGTQACNGGNVCYTYGCDDTSGCSAAQKGNGTKCGGNLCVGDTFHKKDYCENGSCKNGGTTNCNNQDGSCRNGWCNASTPGCTYTDYASGYICEAKKCVGQTYHKADTCNGSGTCNDNGSVNCDLADSQCANGYCSTSNPGCYVSNHGTTTTCTSTYSNYCDGNTWHPQDYCNGSGSCTDSGSSNCAASSTTCRVYSCSKASGGCVYTDKDTSVLCAGKYCINGCNAQNNTYCNGSGSCSHGGGGTNCGGQRCVSGSCTTSCSTNGQCCQTSPWSTYTCIGGSCTTASGCLGACDDAADCTSGLSCVNCSGSACSNHASGTHCYKGYGASSLCGCSAYDIYMNCIKYKTCWHC